MEDRRQEDLDMFTILSSIRRGILAVWRSFIWLIRFSFSKFLTIGFFCIITVGLMLTLFYFSKPYYECQLSVSHIRVDNQNCKEMVQNLAMYIDSRNDNMLLARNLNVSPHTARQVLSIEYNPISENLAKRFADSTNVLIPFKIEVEVYNTSVLDSLQTGIINYLEANEYARRRKILDSIQLVEAQIRLAKEMGEIDSLKQIVNSGIIPRSSGNGIILGEPIDPINVYKRGLDIYDRKLMVEKKLSLNDSFEVLVGFNKAAKRASKGLLFYIAVGLLTGYIFSMFYLFRRKRNAA